MAYQQVVEYGMSPRVGHISLRIKGSRDLSKTFYSDKLCKMIDEVSVVLLSYRVAHCVWCQWASPVRSSGVSGLAKSGHLVSVG